MTQIPGETLERCVCPSFRSGEPEKGIFVLVIWGFWALSSVQLTSPMTWLCFCSLHLPHPLVMNSVFLALILPLAPGLAPCSWKEDPLSSNQSHGFHPDCDWRLRTGKKKWQKDIVYPTSPVFLRWVCFVILVTLDFHYNWVELFSSSHQMYTESLSGQLYFHLIISDHIYHHIQIFKSSNQSAYPTLPC